MFFCVKSLTYYIEYIYHTTWSNDKYLDIYPRLEEKWIERFSINEPFGALGMVEGK